MDAPPTVSAARTDEEERKKNDDLEALIDLLAQGDDSTDSQREGQMFLRASVTVERSRSNDNEQTNTNAASSAFSFDPSRDAKELDEDGPRQSTPAPDRKEGEHIRVDAVVEATGAALFSPESAELALPSFPPMAPQLSAVRSLAQIVNPSPLFQSATPTPASFAARPTHGGLPPNFRLPLEELRTAAVSNADLLPVSPFLLSPALQSQGLALPGGKDSSRSPFFAAAQAGLRSNASTPGSSPQLRMRSLSQASMEAMADSLTMRSTNPKRNSAMSPASRSSSMETLVADLEKARAELQAVRDECEYLRHVVHSGLPSPSAGVEVPTTLGVPPRKRLSDSADAVAGSRDVTLTGNMPEPPTTPKREPVSARAAAKPEIEDEIERLSEREAKDKLREILSYLSLPPSALDNIPPTTSIPRSIPVTPTRPRSRPSSRNSPRAPSVAHISPPVSASAPRSFADVKRALTFVEQADELVWKRALLASYGLQVSTGGAGRKYVAPLDVLRLRDGQTIRRRTTSTGSPGESGDEGNGTKTPMNVFDEANVKALEERLGLWERVVRARPRR